MSDFLGDTRDLLRRTPDVLRALLTGLPETWTATPDVADGWRPRDVVGHLISGELDDWIPRTQRILEHGTAMAFDPFDRFAHVGRDAEASLDALIDRFAELRTDNLAKIDALATDDNLDRRGLHPSLGDVTLRELLATGPCTTSTTCRRSTRGSRARTTPRSGRGRRTSASCSAATTQLQSPGEPESRILEAQAGPAVEAGRSRRLSIVRRTVLDPVRGSVALVHHRRGAARRVRSCANRRSVRHARRRESGGRRAARRGAGRVAAGRSAHQGRRAVSYEASATSRSPGPGSRSRHRHRHARGSTSSRTTIARPRGAHVG